MKLGKILSRIGSAALKSIPGVGAATEIIEFVNDCLPHDKKVDENTSGSDALAAIDGLPPQQKNEVLLKNFDVEIAEIQAYAEIQESLAKVDIVGASTRPHIAKLFAWNTVLITDLLVAAIVWAILAPEIEILKLLDKFWPMILSLLSPFVILLRSYFGLRSKEKAQKYQAVTGIAPVASTISNLIGKVLK